MLCKALKDFKANTEVNVPIFLKLTSDLELDKIGTFTSVLALKSFKALHNIENSSLSWKLCKFSVLQSLKPLMV
jgi:dihydroorotate dehydrogenase